MKSKDGPSKLGLILAYLGVWVISLIAFWFFTKPWEALGYGIVYLYVLLPVATLVVSLLIGLYDHWGRWKWILALAFGIMFMLAGYATFSMANMIAFHKVNVPEFGMIPVGTILSLVGMGIGFGINRLVSWRRRRREPSE